MLAKHHSYSSDSRSREMAQVYLALISTGLAYLLYFVCQVYSFSIPWWIEAPSIFGFYGLLYFGFVEWAWQWRFVRFIFRIKTPNWNGVYEGALKTSHDNFTQAIPFKISIVQKWNRIVVTGKTASSTSHSFLGFFSEEDTDSPTLVYQYLNLPNITAIDAMNAHRGVAQVILENDLLNGEFFNGKGRNTIGTFELSKIK